MPRLTLIYPCVGRFPDTRYVRSWQMQPLAIAALASLTPSSWDKAFYDDRLEPIDYDHPTDLAAISVETYTARRAYQIAKEFHRRGVPVVMGGYHATLSPEEALEHADAVCVGEAEGVWHDILRDAESGRLSGLYSLPPGSNLRNIGYDRSIFRGKDYFRLALVETSRGCRFKCSFCSITAFYNATYRRRPVNGIIEEIRQLNEQMIFFVDDNVIGDTESAKELFTSLKPLGIKWISQASVNVALDPELLDLMAESGCAGLLVGFESLNPSNLDCMQKRINQAVDYKQAVHSLRERGILIYGTFIFGFPGDSPQLVRETVRFAREQKLFLAAFAHLVPFPGTPLYSSCEAEGRLIHKRWWLSKAYRFGQAPYRPVSMEPSELETSCHHARKEFYRLSSILQRGLDFSANCSSTQTGALFFSLNLLLRKEVSRKRGLPLGLQEHDNATGTN